MYDNERFVGEGIAAAAVDREAVFLILSAVSSWRNSPPRGVEYLHRVTADGITTKVWRSNLRGEDVRSTVRESLEKLGVEYVDLLLIHRPHPRVPVEETLDAMTTLREEGAVRHLGVSNFTRSQIRNVMQVVDAPIVTDQVLYHPYKRQDDLREFCAGNDTALTAYSPLARGDVLEDDMLAEIGARYDKTAPQVLRWLIQQDSVIAIPKATGRKHLAENLAVFDFSLLPEEMGAIHDRRPGLRRRLRNYIPRLVRRVPV